MIFSQFLFQKILNLLTKIGLFSNIKNYKGDYKDGLRDGKGRLEFIDGTVYEGQFENNKMHGYGKIFYKDGSIYQGNFRHNLRDGTGISRTRDGSQKRKVYKKGKFKEIYTEDYTIHWENTVSGTFKVRAADCSKAIDIFDSLTKEELLEKSKLSTDMKKMRVTDMSVFVQN